MTRRRPRYFNRRRGVLMRFWWCARRVYTFLIERLELYDLLEGVSGAPWRWRLYPHPAHPRRRRALPRAPRPPQVQWRRGSLGALRPAHPGRMAHVFPRIDAPFALAQEVSSKSDTTVITNYANCKGIKSDSRISSIRQSRSVIEF